MRKMIMHTSGEVAVYEFDEKGKAVGSTPPLHYDEQQEDLDDYEIEFFDSPRDIPGTIVR